MQITMELVLIHENDRAYLVGDGEREIWLPKSQVAHDGGDEFTMPEWLAIEKELV